MTPPAEPTLLARKQGRIGRITLNRPQALNALELPMIHALSVALETWRDDPAVHAVVLEAAGERAFCAGGDIRAVRDLLAEGDHDAIEAFFVHEYALNRTIARYPKPILSLIDGICMGGGIGISVHGAVRVASEHARFAMPEVQIGLFPDIGATFILPRLRGTYGMWMALTGARIAGPDASWLGLATHYVPRERMAGLADDLAANGIAALATAALPPPPGELPALADGVAAFGLPTLPAVIAALERQQTAWSQATLASLRSASPTALSWTFQIVRAGGRRTLEQCQRAELALTRQATRYPDFAEGVRAMVIDKDRAPRWSPPRLEDVDPEFIAEVLRLE
ncbi:MAG: enoyl-CoA hydratase/isomerase family protein [Acetobacteraceae bacterium]|nr:enoyl-CoA hydratase/isomerase family protein [Acetobacteraceae bacterium]